MSLEIGRVIRDGINKRDSSSEVNMKENINSFVPMFNELSKELEEREKRMNGRRGMWC